MRRISTIVIPAVLYLAWLVPSCIVPELRLTDENGCVQPPATTFRKAGIDAKVAQSTFGKVVTGEVSIAATPEAVSFISSVAQEEELRAYHRCLAVRRDHFTFEQATYLEQMYLFARTKPTAEQFQKWQRLNPFPKATIASEPQFITSIVVSYLTDDDSKEPDENISARVSISGREIGQGGPWGGGELWAEQEYLNNGQPHIFEIPLNHVTTDALGSISIVTIKSESTKEGGHRWNAKIRYGYRATNSPDVQWMHETGTITLGGEFSSRYQANL